MRSYISSMYLCNFQETVQALNSTLPMPGISLHRTEILEELAIGFKTHEARTAPFSDALPRWTEYVSKS